MTARVRPSEWQKCCAIDKETSMENNAETAFGANTFTRAAPAAGRCRRLTHAARMHCVLRHQNNTVVLVMMMYAHGCATHGLTGIRHVWTHQSSQAPPLTETKANNLHSSTRHRINIIKLYAQNGHPSSYTPLCSSFFTLRQSFLLFKKFEKKKTKNALFLFSSKNSRRYLFYVFYFTSTVSVLEIVDAWWGSLVWSTPHDVVS